MITKETVLVLGAGASAPYGFPVGSRLLELIQGMTPDVANQLPAPPGAHIPPGEPGGFISSLRTAHPTSIDGFLAHRPDLEEPGKAAIATILLPYERKKYFPAQGQTDHWYRLLLQAMDCPWERFQENKLSVVTFNYDRSLEYFLMNAVREKYGRKPEEVRQKLATIPIVHVYGSLGSLDEGAQDYVPYGAEDPRFVRIAARHIQVMNERRDSSDSFDLARRLISDCDALCFLGFAFDQLNVERLGGKKISAGFKEEGAHVRRDVDFAASCHGLTDRQVDRIVSWIAHPNAAPRVRQEMYPKFCSETLASSLILG